MTKERDVNAPGGGHNLRNYWVRGEGAAKIRWGTDGSFARCVAQLSSKVKNPQGLCAEYHKAATGEWPAEKGVESSMSEMVEAHGTHNQQDHDPTKGKGFPSSDKINLKGSPEYERGIGARRSNDYEDDEDTTGDVGGDLPDPDQDNMFNPDYDDEREFIERIKNDPVLRQQIDDDWEDLKKLLKKFSMVTAAGNAKRKKKPKVDTYATGDGDEPWSGVLSVEGVESGDGRLFGLGSLDWERPPQPLMYQPANVGGHNASILVGQIQNITRHGSRIRGEGVVFGSALAGEHGESIRHMMETGGVSVDVDKVKDADVEMIYADDESGDGTGNMFSKPETTIFHRGRIRGATLVAFPAFVEAKLAFTGGTLTASVDPESCGCDDDDPLVAASHTITIPNLPPAAWFDEPTDVKLSGALTITDEGRVYGIVAPADTNHRNHRNTKVPRNLDFSRFHKGETIVQGGGRVVTGIITAGCGHAATEGYGTLNNRIEHYDNSCSVLANIRVGYGRGGHIWAAGALNPGADARQVAQALGCALSLDVQPHPDRPGIREFIAAHLAPVPGFPLARTQASVVYQDGVLAASSIPVVHVSESTYVSDTFAIYHAAKQALATSIGMDYPTRKAALAAELELI